MLGRADYRTWTGWKPWALACTLGALASCTLIVPSSRRTADFDDDAGDVGAPVDAGRDGGDAGVLDVPRVDATTDAPRDVPPDVPGLDAPCDPVTGFLDGDGDTYGSGPEGVFCRELGLRIVGTGGDCDDFDAAVNPGATEACDGVDVDCGLNADEDDPALDATCDWRACSADAGSARCDEPVEIEAGWYHTCVRVEPSGTLWCWGLNDVGQLGVAGTADVTTPTRTGMSGVVDHCALGTATCVLTRTEVMCFGASAISSPTVSFSATLSSPAEIACGANHICVRSTTGEVRCAGDNGASQSGVDRAITTTVATLTALSFPATPMGLTAGSNFSCALLTGGAIHCWGADSGILGRGTRTGTTVDHVPAVVEWMGPAFVEVDAMNFAACARTASGVACWGNTPGLQVIGRDMPAFVTSPTPVTPNFASLHGAVAGHACALAADGAISCWGRTFTHAMAANPRTAGVASFTPAEALPLAGPTELLASDLALGDANDPPGRGAGGHTCAIERGTGRVYCWGSNNHGQCGAAVTATLPDAVEVRP